MAKGTKEEIKQYMNSLYRRSKADLIETVKRNHRVIDLKGVSKDELVSMLLQDKFGRGYDRILFAD